MNDTSSIERISPQRTAPWVVPLSAAEAWGIEELGGKGARLAELVRAGFPVPSGFCVTASAFRDFKRVAQIDEGTRGRESVTRETIRSAPLPDGLTDELLRAYGALGKPRVAVRSSAPGEDGQARSFAGQYDTMLDVEGDAALLDALRLCWASLWSERARAYGTMAGERGPSEMAVVVQRMVAADVAGVLFTRDPLGQGDRMVVEACLGLGEGLVAGRVTTDSFILDRDGLQVLSRQIRYKPTMCTRGVEGRAALIEAPPDRREAPSLSDDAVRELANLGRRVRAHYGGEQDIEWAVEAGAVHLLQARPITVSASRAPSHSPYEGSRSDAVRRRTLWSRMDIGEIFTGRMSPLGISFARYYQNCVHGDCARALGLRMVDDVPATMGYLQGHVYLNVSYSAFLLSQTPPGRDQHEFTTRFTSEEVDLRDYANPFGTFPSGLPLARSFAHWLHHLVVELATMKRRAKRMVASRFEEYDRMCALALTVMSTDELGAELERDLRYFHDMHVGYMPYYINAFGFYGLLTQLCTAWIPDARANLQNRLKADMSNLRTVEAAREVWRLARAARTRPRVADILRQVPVAEMLPALRGDAEGSRFLKLEFEPFLRMNGSRARQEMELTNPRWADDPSYVFQMMRKYISENLSVDDVLERSRRERGVDTAAILGRLPAGRRALLRQVIGLYSTCSELRETVRPSMTTSVWLIRRVVYEVGRRLVDLGFLRSLEEVAYLDFARIRSYLAGQLTASRAFSRADLEAHRRQHEAARRLPEPPLTFVGEHVPSASERPPTGSLLSGLGASPGRVVGRARVVHDLVRQADAFVPGEILVTAFTDASWTPLFAMAAGVVTDVGSMLSHSSIVAREFGIPSVVNTRTATLAIRTGDTVVLDGDASTVEVRRGES